MIIAILGPTASGKTAFSIELANEFDGEIVSADSVAVYKGFDIGSAKPTNEEREKAIFHLVDFADPKNVNYSVGNFQTDSHRVIDDILKRGKLPIVCGGSGLYADVALNGLDTVPEISKEVREKVAFFIENDFQGAVLKLKEIDPERAGEIDLKNPRRVAKALEIYEMTGKPPTLVYRENQKPKRPPYTAFCLTMEREKLIERINLRVDKMVEMGLFQEVEKLLDYGVNKDSSPMSSIGYRECVKYFEGELSKEEAVERIKISTRQFAKRQYTWFRKYSNVIWIDINNKEIIKKNLGVVK